MSASLAFPVFTGWSRGKEQANPDWAMWSLMKNSGVKCRPWLQCAGGEERYSD
ncbi:hypothetical protein ABK730_16340 [Klebsiella indica]|uniref:hypothetical protein n=1 Tax=Klebsiella TaxID=570 RepID=UPI001486AB37|nr:MULTISPECIES: hypothetical protein [Klebsiella]